MSSPTLRPIHGASTSFAKVELTALRLEPLTGGAFVLVLEEDVEVLDLVLNLPEADMACLERVFFGDVNVLDEIRPASLFSQPLRAALTRGAIRTRLAASAVLRIDMCSTSRTPIMLRGCVVVRRVKDPNGEGQPHGR